jgi:hypothetical protein
VNPSKKHLTLTKVMGATRQTDAAISAFARGDFDIAITLAGAAEGMINREGQHLFGVFRDSAGALEVEEKKWIATLNIERDWLKHPSGPLELQLGREEAAMMIARTASKLEEWSPQMKEFKNGSTRILTISHANGATKCDALL